MTETELIVVGKPSKEASVDIIFIHGMGGDAISTWQSEGGFWPEWVAEENPSSRVYSVKFPFPAIRWQQNSTLKISDRSKMIMDLLVSNGVGARPIVFIAHSLGGILIKSMLNISAISESQEHVVIWEKCVSVIFLSTPTQRYFDNPIFKLISPIRDSDDQLRAVSEWYRKAAPPKGITTLAFSASDDQLISADNADPGISGSVVIPINADHVQISKPSSKNAHLVRSVQSLLERIVKLPEPKREDQEGKDVSELYPETDGPRPYVQIPEVWQNNAWYHHDNQNLVLVFVHGVLSDASSCWLNKEANVYWPDLLINDKRISSADIFLAGYYTALDSGTYEVSDAADEVMRSLRRKDKLLRSPVLSYPKIVFVTHSLGGVVVRYLLNANREEFRDKEVGLMLYASPSYGSKLADRLELIQKYFQNAMGHQLRWGNWTLRELDDNFKELQNKNLIPALKGAEAIENRFIIHYWWFPFFRKTFVVTKESAGRYFGKPRVIPETDHFTIVKPDHLEHASHLFLVDFLTDNSYMV
jgi:triacylglycerol esterase/lipase EstA (alpha/beta hydrolase family)